MKKLENQVALVTAATKGIGLACALKLAENGATIYMGVRRIEATQEICDQYKSQGFKMFPIYFDAYKSETYKAIVEEIIAKEGRLDILVNNFGVGKPETDLDLVKGSEEAFLELFKLNVGTVYGISKAAVPHMMKQGKGSIINISSIGGAIPDVTRIGYGVSKAAVNNITQQIAMQYARANIRCNAVLPGLTATDAALNNMPQSFIDSFLSHVPLNRMGKPEDIANAVLFFASDDSSYITGNIMEVAGGYGLGTPQYGDIMRHLHKQ
ncbi:MULTISPECIES: SDR family oxidoreductase [Zhenhengia]|jgi:3-oxoacyl-[acyl-carrier protein] reductase|uniref:7alpha-hydroxysteroid dehydrogenase n=1 Tax=Zhenhengia TaxID=2944196 RepID=UPI00290BF8DB|nr:SDR family oxidoreductase [Zhenhengia yiwuensis]MDU6360394.1 SDR family oxidoreductase [Clostridiales bacterium]MDY3367058.1 SDR family oxidoreductase [Zhenhengia yiwuensis]